MKNIELENLKSSLKFARKKYGKDSKQVFKLIKHLKSLNPHNEYEDIEEWENHTLWTGSFCGLRL